MTSKKLPWDEIGQPDSDYNVRYIPDSGINPIAWGKDPAGQSLFILELKGNHFVQFQAGYTAVHGIKIDLRQLPNADRQRLVLSLEKSIDQDIFHSLCLSLVEHLKPVEDSSVALSVVMNHIKRWKAFLAGRKTSILTPEEVRGLFAELEFLRVLYREYLSDQEAIRSWYGPEGVHQDFIFNNTAVEVKSITGRERSSVRISSEDQLEAICDNLFLAIIRLSETAESLGARSLNEEVDLVVGELSDPEAIEIYWEKLVAYGYMELREYDNPRFIATSPRPFRVTEDFPRLVRSQIPDGVARVHYEIELEKISNFECERSQIWEE